MNLTERDESDLAGLASELGNADSNARAQHLVRTNPEAAEFLRQITSVCQTLRAQGEGGASPLPDAERDALAATILARVEQGRAGRKRGFRYGWRWGAVAAAVMLGVATWFSSRRDTRPVVARAVYTPLAASLNHEGAAEPHRARIRAGQVVETRDEYAALSLTGGGQVAVSHDTRLVIPSAGRPIELQEGSLFIRAATVMQIRAGDAVIALEEIGLVGLVRVASNEVKCTVYAGRAKIIRQSRETQLATGQIGAWDPASEGVRVTPSGAELPGWVSETLEGAAGLK